jgi:hypothetical protein
LREARNENAFAGAFCAFVSPVFANFIDNSSPTFFKLRSITMAICARSLAIATAPLALGAREKTDRSAEKQCMKTNFVTQKQKVVRVAIASKEIVARSSSRM